MNKNKTGLALGGLVGMIHAVWLVLVATGFAEWYMDFIFDLHRLSNPFVVLDFAWSKAVLLVVVTSVIGYAIGWLYAGFWNYMHRR